MDPYLTPHIKINSKWIKALNVRAKTIKLLEKNIGENLHDIGLGNDFLAMIPKTLETEEKIDKSDFITIKNVCASKHTMHRVERPPVE